MPGKPAPVPTPEKRPYWDGRAAGELSVILGSGGMFYSCGVLVPGRSSRS